MVQKKTQKTQKNTVAKKTTPIKKSTAIQVVEPNPVPAVIPGSEKKKTSPLRIVITTLLFIATVIIWFLVGQKVFVLVTQDVWLKDHFGGRRVEAVADEIVATVNGKPVFLSDVKTFANGIPQLAELPFEMVYPQLLETLVDSKVMLTAAEAAGTENLPDVQKALRLSRDQILSQAYLNKKLEASVTNEQLQALYTQEMADFKPVEEIRARHILVKTQKEAKDIIIQLKAGADFGLLAEKYSLDQNSPKGDLGYFSEDMMIPEFGKAAFALKVGQISDAIKTPFGWHVVVVEDKRMSEAPAFEDVKEQLRQVAMEQNARKVLAEERQKQNVVIQKPRLLPKK